MAHQGLVSLLRPLNKLPTKKLAGRTTFVNTLCGRRVLQPKDADDAANAHLEEGVRIKPVTVGRWMKKDVQMVQDANNPYQSLN